MGSNVNGVSYCGRRFYTLLACSRFLLLYVFDCFSIQSLPTSREREHDSVVWKSIESNASKTMQNLFCTKVQVDYNYSSDLGALGYCLRFDVSKLHMVKFMTSFPLKGNVVYMA